MGARGSNFINSIRRRRSGTSRIGTPTNCPICGFAFGARSTYNVVNSHIDSCLESSQIPQVVSEDPKPASEVVGLNFDEKCAWLRAKNDRSRIHWQKNSITLVVERQNLLEHSLNQLLNMTEEDLRSEFAIVFEGELAKDAGGVLREWLMQMNAQLLAAETGMYRLAATENVAYRIQPLSTRDKRYFIMHGILIGKALFENVPINCRLCRPLFKRLAGKRSDPEDLRFLDHSVYTTFQYMQSNDISGSMFETFTVKETNERTGQSVEFELKPGGSRVELCEENKAEYVRLRTEWELRKATEECENALVEGFRRVVDPSVLVPFEAEELELLLCGLPFVDVADWEAFTVYKGEFSAEHEVVRWFWELLEVYSQEQLGLLLQFVMGTTRLPVEGFKALRTLRGEPARFTLESAPYSRSNQFPRAHTCFNRLDLPLYPSKLDLHRSLSYVIANHAVGFGIE